MAQPAVVSSLFGSSDSQAGAEYAGAGEASLAETHYLLLCRDLGYLAADVCVLSLTANSHPTADSRPRVLSRPQGLPGLCTPSAV